MTNIQILATIELGDEKHILSTQHQDNKDVFSITKIRSKNPSFFRYLFPKISWHNSLEEAIEACHPISLGALSLQLMFLGFTVYGIDLKSPSEEITRKAAIYEFSGL